MFLGFKIKKYSLTLKASTQETCQKNCIEWPNIAKVSILTKKQIVKVYRHRHV